MKKITFAVAFFTTALNAQSFPSPYCAITDASEVSVEEITKISFADGIINSTNTADVLVDHTATLVPVTPGETYSLKVYGNTYGDFDTNIVAFIDWNNNGVLDDTGETYAVGTLTDSNGNDGVFADIDITVPEAAVFGTTRIRVTKTYTDEESVAIVNPCSISFDAFGLGAFPGFGQALDFNLTIGDLNGPSFDAKSLSIYPVPAKNSLTVSYRSAIGKMQVYNQLGQEMYAGGGLGSEVRLDISNYAAGVYFIQILNGNETSTFKIIKE